MKNIDLKFWIICLCIAAAVVLLLTSCHASRKNVSINKSHVDSSVVEKKQKVAVNKIDSLATKNENNSYQKITEIILQPVEVDSSAPIPGLIKINSKTPGKQIIFLPQTRITETGNINKTEQTHLQKSNDSTVKEQKNTSVVSDKKEVVKKKVKIGFNLWWLLCLIPIFLFASPQVRTFLKNILWPVKL